jgi:membrane-bound lytic murein transglycosylase B
MNPMTSADGSAVDDPARGTFPVLVAVVATTLLLVAGIAYAVLRYGAGPPSASPSAVAPLPSTAGAPVVRTTDVSRSGSRVDVDPAWVARTATATGVPAPAMRAYADAELLLRDEQPSCHLRWNTLAGIGWIESQHGTIGGRTLGADGRSSSPILGPALDGSAGNAAIRPTPTSRAWHGDKVWEHAVGPLQFLPSTWDRWGADGDGDGSADPRDIDDAALTAARYLCADGHDLTTDGGWNAAVHSYNHDQAYVAHVAAAANTYAARTR